MNATLADILEQSKRLRINATLLKGQSLAALYPDPESRQCGDIDLYISRPDQRRRLIDALGIKSYQNHADGSTTFSYRGSMVELPPPLLDIHSRRAIKRLHLLKPVAVTMETELPGIGTVTIPAPETMLLTLSAHAFKHAIGRGIGLRQLCDIALVSKRLASEVDRAEMDRIFRAAGLERWNRMLYSFLTLRLGLPVESVPTAEEFQPNERLAVRLERIIARGGNFGQHGSGLISRKGVVFTALSFVRGIGFALSIAPREATACFFSLVKGRLGMRG